MSEGAPGLLHFMDDNFTRRVVLPYIFSIMRVANSLVFAFVAPGI